MPNANIPLPTANNTARTQICLVLPPKVNSAGLWRGITDTNFSWYRYPLPSLELHLTVIFAITQISHFFLKRLGLPMITSQLIAGILISPAVVGSELWDKAFSVENVQVLGTIQSFGYSLFLFLIAVKTDLNRMIKVSKTALSIGLLSVIGPLLCSLVVVLNFSDNRKDQSNVFFLSLTHVVTAFPVIASLLTELRIINTELGRLVLSSGLIGDFLSIFIMIVASIMRGIRNKAYDGMIIFFAYAAVVVLVFRPAMLMIVRNTPEGKRVSKTYICAIILMFLVSTCLTRWSQQFILLSPYILGLAVPAGPPLGSALVDMFHSMSYNIFTPLFVSISGMRLRSFIPQERMKTPVSEMNQIIAVVSFLTKFVLSLLPPLYVNMPMKDSVAISLIMSCKGIVELGIFTFLFDAKSMNKDVFSFSFLTVAFVATIVPILVKKLYDPSRKYSNYQKRNIMSSKPNGELQILTCIHVPDNVKAIINFLEVSTPTKDNPLAVNVLHLIKLHAQETPIFISHNKKTRDFEHCLYSENVVLSFSKFEGNNWGAVSVNNFTAVSPSNLMHEDICTLALDKLTSVIILPFHRRWYIDGSIESEDETIRVLNAKVLEKAPCSVGILIDRSNIRRPVDASPMDQSYKVAMLFLGGKDDREALIFAKRMVYNNRIKLTVANFISGSNNETGESEKMLDSVILSEVRSIAGIKYVEKVVADGSETSMIVHSMVNQYDLIIVGRRDGESAQTIGLMAWSEFPELGILGDLLASEDYVAKCSVLVVQQQKIL